MISKNCIQMQGNLKLTCGSLKQEIKYIQPIPNIMWPIS